LNKNYKIFHTLNNQSGFGWDDIEKLPTTPEDVWKAYLEVRILYWALKLINSLEASSSKAIQEKNTQTLRGIE